MRPILILLIVPALHAQFVDQAKLVGTGGITHITGPLQGTSVAISADGNTIAMGGPRDNGVLGAVWVFARNSGVWTQQGGKLVGSGADAAVTGAVLQGSAVALSADGNTLLVGGPSNNIAGVPGSAWVFTRSGATWNQQGPLLYGSGAVAPSYSSYGQGAYVALSADGNTALISGADDGASAVWTFTRANGVWTQEGPKFAGTASSPFGPIGLSADATTALLGTSVYTRANANTPWTQQTTLSTPGLSTNARFGSALALSADGNTALIGAPGDGDNFGAAFVFTRSSNTWNQQGPKLSIPFDGTGAHFLASFGTSVALSADGNTAVIGAPGDNAGIHGPIGGGLVFSRANGAWSLRTTELVGSGEILPSPGNYPGQGASLAISGDGSTVVSGSPNDNTSIGAGWVFTQPTPNGITAAGVLPGAGSGLSQSFTFTFTDPRGWQDLDVVNVLINDFLDGRHSCYIAYSVPTGLMYLVGDDGGTLIPAITLNPSGRIGNSQCSLIGAGSAASGDGNTFTLTLSLTFSAAFAGNRIIYMAARDQHGGNSGWQPLGTWNVPGVATFPAVTTLGPARGSGSTQLFTFTFTDTKGYQDLGVVDILINQFLDGRNACYLAYSRSQNALYVIEDPAGQAPYVTMNTGRSLGGTVCSVDGSSSSVTGAGNTLTLVLYINFATSFAGNHVVYAAARDTTDANNSGWQAMGSWTVQ